jgi:hypothetical protein
VRIYNHPVYNHPVYKLHHSTDAAENSACSVQRVKLLTANQIHIIRARHQQTNWITDTLYIAYE